MPELKQIQLYDFRRFKASKEYHLTGKLLLVKEILGHKATRSTEEATELLEAGFQFVLTTPDGTILFRKRK